MEPTLISLTAFVDERGSWTRVFDESPIQNRFEYGALRQVSVSNSRRKLTIRGMHYLDPLAQEWKFIYCLRGSVLDIAVQVDPDSGGSRKKFSFNLSDENPQLLAIPPGWAHGFQTKVNHSTLLYLMSADYDSNLERGFRYDDPDLNLQWIAQPTYVSSKDLAWPLIADDDAN